MIWAPAALRSSGLRLFTVPCVATGMKAGVSTSPWGVRSRPARAAPSVLTTVSSTARILRDQHRVAVRVETIALGDRVAVRPEQCLAPTEGGGEQQQRRARKVEVRDEGVDQPEAVAGVDEEIGGPADGPEPAICRGRPLECPGGGGSDGNDAPARGPG